MADHDVSSLPASQAQAIRVLLPCAVGWICAVMMYGVYLCLHARYVCSRMYGRISWRVKAVLWGVFALVTIHTGLEVCEIGFWITTTDRSFRSINNGHRFEAFAPLTCGLAAAPVQAMLAVRTAVLIRGRTTRRLFMIATSIVSLFGLTWAILATSGGLLLFNNKSDAMSLDWSKGMAGFLWTSAGINFLISVGLALTIKERIAPFNPEHDHLFKRLIIWALQTASYTAVLSLSGAITSVALGYFSNAATVPYAFWSQLPACYGISLYTTLATRKTADKFLGHHTTTSFPPTRPQGDPHAVEVIRSVRPGLRSAAASGMSGGIGVSAPRMKGDDWEGLGMKGSEDKEEEADREGLVHSSASSMV
ncbi:hypothetical protein JCM6882_007986 [Rhodosporidiobolus microsporus]